MKTDGYKDNSLSFFIFIPVFVNDICAADAWPDSFFIFIPVFVDDICAADARPDSFVIFVPVFVDDICAADARPDGGSAGVPHKCAGPDGQTGPRLCAQGMVRQTTLILRSIREKSHVSIYFVSDQKQNLYDI